MNLSGHETSAYDYLPYFSEVALPMNYCRPELGSSADRCKEQGTIGRHRDSHSFDQLGLQHYCEQHCH